MKLSVIIPARNESATIEATVVEIEEYLSRQSYESEVVLVINGTTDNTMEIAKGLTDRFPRIKVMSSAPGKGQAVQAGMLSATGQWRLFMDADNATRIDQLDQMWQYAENGYDLVIGSIAIPGAQVIRGKSEPLWRVLFGKMGNKWIQLFAVWGINDTQRGFKLISEKATKDIFPRLTIFKWGFDVEVLAIAKNHGYKIKEVPVVWRHNPNSRVGVFDYPVVLMQTLVVFWNKISGRYRRK